MYKRSGLFNVSIKLVEIKTEKPIKKVMTVEKGAKQAELNFLLLLDTTTFIGLREAVAILTLF